MKYSEIVKLSDLERNEKLIELKAGIVNNKFSLLSKQSKKVHVVREMRRDIARILTASNQNVGY